MRIIAFYIGMLCFCAAHAENDFIVAPETFSAITLSNTNPNRFECVNGNVNDVAFPKDIPIEAVPKGKNLFISYKILEDLAGGNSYVQKRHDIHITCAGEVYSFSVQLANNGQATTVRMGDPNKKNMEENAKLLREMSTEELYKYLIMTAINNDYQGNVTATQVNRNYGEIIPGVGTEEVRDLVMNGAGLRLKEFVLRGKPGTQVQKERFIDSVLSSSMLAIAVHPAVIGSDGRTRLFIVESKI